METGKSSLKHLKKDQLSLRHAISQATALNAPGGTIVLYVSSTAALMAFAFSSYPNGAYAIPLILILSLIIYALMSFSMYEFSKELTSSGGYYTFVSRGLGNGAGYITALSYLTYQILSFTGFGILGFMSFVYAIFPSFGITLPDASVLWIPIAIVFVLIVTGLIYSGIKPSLRFVSYTIVVEVAFFILTSLYIIITHHAELTLKPFTTAPVGNSPFIIGAMMVYAIGTFVGIGGSIPIAEETKKPKRNVPLAIVSTVILLGVTIILSSYSQVIYWGFQNMGLFGSTTYPYPVISIYRNAFGSASYVILGALIILVLNSFFTATVSLGTNASRVLFSLSREKVISKRLSATHTSSGTPTVAALVVAAISIVIVVATGLVFELYLYRGSPANALLYASLFLLILESPIAYLVHILTNTSLYVYMKRRNKLSYLRHLIIPSISTITLIFAIVMAVYFDLTPPYIYGIYGALVWIAVIFVAFLIMRTRFKHRLELIGDFSL